MPNELESSSLFIFDSLMTDRVRVSAHQSPINTRAIMQNASNNCVRGNSFYGIKNPPPPTDAGDRLCIFLFIAVVRHFLELDISVGKILTTYTFGFNPGDATGTQRAGV